MNVINKLTTSTFPVVYMIKIAGNVLVLPLFDAIHV